MGLMEIRILLDSPIYLSGQIISGKLFVQVDKPMRIRAIFQSLTVSYSNSEQHIGLPQLIFGNGTKDCELVTGEHVYVFNHQLPINLPGSFGWSDGNMEYYIKVTINRHRKFDYILEQPVIISGPTCMLNDIPLALEPVDEQSSKIFWGHSEPLFMAIHLPYRGYCPGHMIPIKVFLNNQSGVPVVSLCITLEQNFAFHGISKSKYVKSNIFKHEFPIHEGVGCKDVRLNLQLPLLNPTYSGSYRIMNLNYQLKVTARVNAWYHKNLTIRSELIVGTVSDYREPSLSVYCLSALPESLSTSGSQTSDNQTTS